MQPKSIAIRAFSPVPSSPWSYADFETYMSRSETFHAPTEVQREVLNATFDPRLHGFHGPVQAAFPDEASFFDEPGQNEFIRACENSLGLVKGVDEAAGKPTGIWVTALVSLGFK